MPVVGGTDAGSNMPEGFGEPLRPLDANGNIYADRIPSWILVDEHVIRIPWTTVWKSYTPDIRFPTADLDRLQDYSDHLQSLTLRPHDLSVNTLQIPGECAHPRSVFEELYADFPGVIHYLSEDGEADREQIETQGDEYPEVPGLLELLKMIGTGNEGLKRWMEEEEKRIGGEKEERVRLWLTGTSEIRE